MKDFRFNYERVKSTHGSRICDALADFYSLYRGSMLEWIASIWDPASGGFYYSLSAKETEGYDPDIESTGQAMGVIQDLGLTPDPFIMPEPFVGKVVNYLRELQDPDGYFYHRKWGKNINTSRRARDLASARWVVEGYGSSLKYTSAIDRINAAKASSADEYKVPEHLKDKQSFVKYLDGLNINANSYSTGQIIAMQASEIKAAGLDSVCVDFLNATQKENGIWESELNYATANGVLKICHAYNAFGADIPRFELVVDAILNTALRTERPNAIVDVFNPLMGVHYLRDIIRNTGRAERIESAEASIIEKAVEIIELTRSKISLFRQDSGAFSYLPRGQKRGEFAWSQGVIVAPGLDEADMNATQLAKATQLLLTEALGLDTGLPYTVDDGAEFFGLLGCKY